MTPQELQKLIDEKEFAKIAINLFKLTKKAYYFEDIEKILSRYDEVPKLSNWTKNGTGYRRFPTARYSLAVNICSLRDYDWLNYKNERYGFSIITKHEVRKQYLDVVKLIFG